MKRLLSIFLFITTSLHSQILQRSSVFSNSGHFIEEEGGTSKIIGTLGQPFAGISQTSSTKNREGFIPTISVDTNVDIVSVSIECSRSNGESGFLAIEVFDAFTGSPLNIKGVKVLCAIELQFVGNSLLAVMPSGSYRVLVTVEGYLDFETLVDVQVLAITEVEIRMDRIAPTLTVESEPVQNLQITGSHPGTTNYQQTISPGSRVRLSAPATVNEGNTEYFFRHWNLDNVPQPTSEPNLSFFILKDTMAKATYELETHEVDIFSTPLPGVSIQGSHPGSTNYFLNLDQATTITLTAPDNFGGSQFISWVINGIEEVSSFTLTRLIAQDTEVVAVFETPLLLDPGWNLVSLPLEPDGGTASAIHSVAISPIWQWNGIRFEVLDEFIAGKGFWLNANITTDLGLGGDSPLSPDIQLNPGWNLVGLKEQQFIRKSELGTTIGTIWFWDARKQWMVSIDDPALPAFEQGRLFPGRAYWVYRD